LNLESAQAVINQDVDDIISTVGYDSFQPLAGQELLITGVQGLLGGYIVDTLARLNETVLKKDPCWVMGLSRSPIKKDSRVGHLMNRHAMVLHQHDVTKPSHIYNPQFIIHAAGRSSPSIFIQDPIGTIDVNINALRWLLELAIASKAESMCWFSSSEIYGNPPEWNIPTPETYHGNPDPLGPRNIYTESKRCGEAMCLAFHIKYGIPIKIFRPALVYGPGFPVDDKRVLSDFINSAIRGTPIQLKDNGSAI
jgi:UDP-glucuronate decarboxylase